MASKGIDNRILRSSPFPDLADYFKQLLTRISNASVTDHILAGIATDALPLRVAGAWISGFADAASIVKALRYEESAGVRRLAIKRVTWRLRKEPQMMALWDAVGGAAGWLELFAELSVHDVQSLCHALGRTGTFNVGKEVRQRLLTELTTCLMSEHFPQAKLSNPERRSLVKFYANIVPACTVKFVRAWEANANLPRAGGRWMDHAHYKHTRDRCLQHLRAYKEKKFRFQYFKNVFHELPPDPATRHMSQSMLFSLHFLEYLAEHGELEMPVSCINNDIVIPLFRRLARRKVPHDVRIKALNAAGRALAPRMTGANNLDFSTHGPLRNVLYCWDRDSVACEATLLDILHLAPETQRSISLDTIGMMLLRVRSSLRYSLLTLMLAHLRPYSKDLENDSDLQELGPWPSSVFAALPSERSHALLQRLVRLRERDVWEGDIFTSLKPEHATSVLAELSRLRPAGDFIRWGPLRQRNPVFTITHNLDIAILQLHVSPVSVEKDKGWQAVVEERKIEAARARDQADRANWARSAILCSMASGSLDCYEDTLVWARRFNRDPLTVKTLYDRGTLKRFVGVALLSGIPSDLLNMDLDCRAIQDNVAKGNKIMLVLLETAFQGMREPSFQAYHWAAVRELFGEVVKRRLAKADEVQDKLSLSDDQMYEMLWEDTLRTVLLAEEQCLMDEHEKLGAQREDGLLGQTSSSMVKSIRPSKCRFVDELAKSRNELWQKHRRSKDSNVVLLNPPWPQGLSFKVVSSVIDGMDNPGYAGRLPYLEARTESVVFANPRDVLSTFPEDKDVRKAIRGHVDDYRDALEFYVRAGVDEEDRDRRKRLAWDHAIGPLSEGRGLSADEAVRFWEKIFKMSWDNIPSSKALQVPSRPDPTIPAVDDPDEPTEWNPDPNPLQWRLPSRELRPTCLDAMLQSTKSEFEDPSFILKRPTPNIAIVESPAAFWDDYYNRPSKTVAPAAREGLAALGLMLVNSKCCPSKRLFAKPFPSSEDARFPALFLDEEFLDRDGISQETGLVILERLAKDAPLTLIAELCEAMLSNLSQEKDARRYFEEETLRLLKILVESDRPNLALDLVRKVVIERPDASSWHRHMLTKGLFDRLKSERARSFIWDIALNIKTKLQEQAQRKVGVHWDPPAATGPVIKVTTVTAMAQLLSGAKFLTGDETIDILTDIFANASHPDIRVAIIQSLTSILQKTRLDTVKVKIMDALEAYAVPIASSMSERSPMTEEDWQKAKSTFEVAEVNDPQNKGLQPVLSAIADAYGSLSGETVSEIYRRILLPILDASAANNRRWMRIFLRRQGLRCDIESLPLVPVKPYLLSTLAKKDVTQRREEVYTLWGEAIMANLDPPADVAEVNSTIANNKDLRASNAGRHWLSLWSNPGVAALSYAGSQLHSFLEAPDLSKINVGPVPIPLVQRIVFDQLEIMIMRDDERFSEQNFVLNSLARPQHKNAAWEGTWDANVRPLISKVVGKIEGLRTPDWQRDPQRKPIALRDTFDMRLWLLTWPGYDGRLLERPEHDTKLSTFASELSGELHRLISSGKPYHAQFTQVKDTARAIHPQDFCYLALHFGTGWERLRLEDYLGIEIAETLLIGVVEPKSAKVAKAVREMMGSWCGSSDERVRLAGMRTATVFRERKERDLKWFWELTGNA